MDSGLDEMKTLKELNPEQLCDRMTEALRSEAAPPFPVVVAEVFPRASPRLRARLLECLLRSVGPLALAVVAAGAFAKFVARAGWPGLSVTAEDATSVSAAQVQELARYVEQADPRIVDQIASILARDASVLAILGTSVIALLAAVLARRARRDPPAP